MKIAAAAVVMPRMEWPFIEEWAEYLAAQGVQMLWLFPNERPQGFVWQKKPQAPKYWPELDDQEIARRWESALEACSRHLLVRQRPVPDQFAGPAVVTFVRQRACLPIAAREAALAGCDWLLNCDPDEFPCSLQFGTVAAVLEQVPSKTGIVFMRQRVFESRWGAGPVYAPRRCAGLTRYCRTVVALRKYIVRPEAAAFLGVHKVKLHAPYREAEADPETLFLKHYRGLETARHPGLRAIVSLPDVWP